MSLIRRVVTLAFKIVTFIMLFRSVSVSATGAHEHSSRDAKENIECQIRSLKVDVNLVLLNATVTGPHDRIMTGLSARDFRVFEDKVEQEIAFFGHEKVPTSIGIVLDVSGSMALDITLAKHAVVTLLRTSGHQDEYFLITFSDKPEIGTDFTSTSTDVETGIAFQSAGGSTSLYDAISLALEKMNQAHLQKKAIVLITDGKDNNSHYTFDDIRDAIKESDIQIYPIGVMNTLESEQGDDAMLSLMEIARMSGGKAYFLRLADRLEDLCAKIGLQIRNQYLLGYYSTNNKNKSWRKIKVKLTLTPGLSRLSVRAKAGYYAH